MKANGRRVEIKKGFCIGAGGARVMLALVAVGAVVLVVRELPGLRRYLKAESM
ncbi:MULTISPECIES: hypothetical protein [unclassified Actinomadura]|uniref:DUF6893 family small protein n=1 Tax=unclassified Actinomadura TaxID=2626254 RepID=UPI00135B4F02|nr:hypothetical protein [Actinomadura sp. K4S16]